MRDTGGGCTLFLHYRHLENTLCQLGSCPPHGRCDKIRAGNAQLDEILSVPPLFLLPSLLSRWQNACSVCQTRVPGLPGQKGEKGSPGAQGVEGVVGEKVHVASCK